MTSQRQKNAGFLLPDQVDGHPTACLRMTIPDVIEYRDAIVGLLFQLGKWWNWEKTYSPGDERAKQAAAYWREFLRTIQFTPTCDDGSCDDVKLRQNPDDPCELQISYDDGQTWELAFDYSLCQRPTVIDFDAAIEFNTQIVNDNDVYQGDIINITNNWGYGDENDVYRDEAMCWASRQFVDLMCDFAIRQLRAEAAEEKDDLQFAADIQTGMAFVGGLMVGFSVFPPALAVGAIALAIGAIGTNIIAQLTSADVSDFQDDDAKEAVACRIYDLMKGATPTFTAWRDALDGHSFSGAAGAIADVCYVAMQSEDAFVQWLKLMADMIGVSQTGANLGCPCEGWCYLWEFTGDLLGWTLIDGYNETWGIWIGDVNDPTDAAIIEREGDWMVDSIRFYHRRNGYCVTPTATIVAWEDGVEVVRKTEPVITGDTWTAWSSANPIRVTKVRLKLHIPFDDPGTSGVLLKAEMSCDTGANPFGQDNCL